MKTQTLLSLLLALPLLLPAQWATPPQFEWARTFGGFSTIWTNSVSAARMEVDEAGNVYIGGHFENFICFGDTCLTSTTPDFSDVFLAKFDAAGEMKWIRKFGLGGIDEAEGLGLTPNGDLLLAVNFTEKLEIDDISLLASTPDRYLYGPADAVVLRFDSAGNAISYVRPIGNRINLIEALAVNDHGQFFVAGRTISDTLSFGHVVLSPLEETTFFLAGYEANQEVNYALSMSGLTQVLSADNRGQVYAKGYFGGSLHVGDSLLGETTGSRDFFFKLSSNGELLWHRTYSDARGFIRYLQADQDNNLYVTGAIRFGEEVRFDSITFKGGYFLLKMDSTMKPIWGYGFEGGWFRGGALSLIEEAVYVPGSFRGYQIIEDTLIQSFRAFPSHDNFDALLLRHDPQTGELIWFKQIGWTGDDGAGPVKAMPSGELYFLGGFSDNRTYADSLELLNPYPGISQRWLGKTAADSLAPPVPVPETGWVVYPNPVKEHLWLSGQWEEEKPVQVELFALDGRRVLQKQIAAGSFSNPLSLSVPALRPGMYILRIRQGAQVGSYKIVKTQP